MQAKMTSDAVASVDEGRANERPCRQDTAWRRSGDPPQPRSERSNTDKRHSYSIFHTASACHVDVVEMDSRLLHKEIEQGLRNESQRGPQTGDAPRAMTRINVLPVLDLDGKRAKHAPGNALL